MSRAVKTVCDLAAKKAAGEKITMLTAHDAAFGALVDRAGVDLVLVGDSLAMVALGHDSTVPVTMDEMIHHAKAVRRGVREALLVGDMPFLSYQAGERDAIVNAGRFLKEAGCAAVKLEGGAEVAAIAAAVVRAGIPVVGHIGLTPQTAGQLGGFKVQGRDAASAAKLEHDARTLAAAGVSALVLECVPALLAGRITAELAIPTIGIGAGPHCDGQVLVTHDLLGLFRDFTPKFAKQYARLADQADQALAAFKREVTAGEFPAAEHSFGPLVEEKGGLADK
ncbi:3-methyl-2-oxobutanoate hydroxymethyltransferase [Desulfurivibrio alkaliphilus]|uniref:3-methyl-2-oxobutanoate hydroxymethyltransferase n=1 Tax=Desulfurivibrio alkaliphilus (strain DSM 19089 / UNIQEM U267 / AHT2) TaxID=589865 RepID=D6Z2X7_DESAT|nr:3-methyl-2-oxobutanoate hydroxymethyltransferase [Desulfurivibrio alkaliphilus]ADH85902.1 3-methyl-2-oxobutanoate hydroxymethyltransferase [Desulfurivibrio alkaliphilus AHT 2]